ncbi:MAG: hypothetical protein A2Y25_04820 [Candidatus Melainabacteria bacterium GWF2_37_15]|nr:MAG: hypothetical protein A2Y25_04820 [Candidatus Melainabacteria bacterium GWF2_37_15]
MLNLFKEKTKSRLGVEIFPEGITLALLKMENNHVSVKSLIHKPVENYRLIPETLKAALIECKADSLNVAISVPGNAAFVKRIVLPELPQDELKEIAPQEASKYLPLPIREMNIDFEILENTRRQDETGKKIDVVMCAISKAVLKEYLDPVFDAGLGVDMIDVSSFALIRALSYEGLINEAEKTYISVLIGYENTDINIIQGGMPVFSYNIQTGRKNIIENIMNSVQKTRAEVINLLPELSLMVPGMEMNEDPELQQASSAAKNLYSNISSEVQKTIEFFNSGNSQYVDIEKIIVSGNGACIQNIDKFMSNKLRIETIIFSPLYSTSIGLALKGFEN